MLILIGCPSVDFESETVVLEDGSVMRTTRFEASDEDRDELRSAYTLPEGGEWASRTERWTGDDGKRRETETDTYSVTARYRAGAVVPSDHVRTGGTEGRALKNVIELDVRNYFFVRTFDYREVYRDDVGKRFVHALVEEAYPDWVEHVASALTKKLDGVELDQARRVVRDLSETWVAKFLASEYIPELGSDETDDAIVDAFLAALVPANDDARDVIDSVLDESFEKWLDRDDVEEAIGGVYEDWVFGEYSFEQTLTMPGTIVETNADAVTGSVLTWEFGQDAFFLQDYALEARSRAVYPERIVAAIVVALGGFFGGAWSGQRSARAGSPKR